VTVALEPLLDDPLEPLAAALVRLAGVDLWVVATYGILVSLVFAMVCALA
jgi:hypothetical protein